MIKAFTITYEGVPGSGIGALQTMVGFALVSVKKRISGLREFELQKNVPHDPNLCRFFSCWGYLHACPSFADRYIEAGPKP